MPSIQNNNPPVQPPSGDEAAKKAAIAAAKAGVAVAAGAMAGGAVGAAAALAASQLDTKEVVKLANSVKDSLTVKFTHDTDKAIAQWKKASTGQKLDSIQNAVKDGVSPTKALTQSKEASKALNRSQKDNIAAFMKAVAEYGQVKESKNDDFTKKNLIDVLTEGVKEHGITLEQLELIGNEDFTVEDYLAMVKNGESVV